MKLLIPLLAALAAAVPTPAAPPRFEDEIKAYEAQDRAAAPKKGGIVFAGSSSIRLWKTLKTDFPKRNVVNRGFGGSVIAECTAYAPRIVIPLKPRLIVFFAGTNDIAMGAKAEQVLADFKEYVSVVKAAVPKARFAFISITPAPSRWKMVDEMAKANRLVRDWSFSQPEVAYIDAWSCFTAPDGSPRPDLFVQDQLHLAPSGYALWTKTVAPYLAWGLEKR